MVKKFYYSLVSLKYSFFMFGLPFLIFVFAFLNKERGIAVAKPIMMVLTGLLAVVMVFYYRDKYKISKALKKIGNLQAYEEGGMVDRSYILEDRMLVCSGFEVTELKPDDIMSVTYQEGKYGKGILLLKDEKQTYPMSTLSLDEARRFAAFLKRKNKTITITGIEPSGNGTLKELGA